LIGNLGAAKSKEVNYKRGDSFVWVFIEFIPNAKLKKQRPFRIWTKFLNSGKEEGCDGGTEEPFHRVDGGA
jgi:hypothetical protein